MSTTIASQLQAIKSRLQGSADPARRPFTRPSVLFDSKEAADIDLKTILSIAVSGLEVLIGLDVRFASYRNTLFSNTSLELDREKLAPKEEEKINKSVSSYLRLLSGHLQLPAALKTLEYLIRRYQVHVFNMDELVLSALPYHDTHAFVRIVQLLELGNKKWGFLEGVKASGAAPPRRVLVQQCIRDKGILETLCNYACPTKEFQHSRPVVCFCTTVIVEALGVVPQLDDDVVKRVLDFVFNGLNPAMKGGRDNKAGALMVVGLLASRATLASKLVQNLIYFIARVAQLEAKESADLLWLRVIIMAIVSLVQSQSVQVFPMKSLKILIEVRDLAGLLKRLSEEFNIEKFLSAYLETLTDYSSSDDSFCMTLITTIETIPVKDFIENIVSKVLALCVKLSQSIENSKLHEAASWAKQILVAIDKHYPYELRGAVCKFREHSKMYGKEVDAIFNTLCLAFGENLAMPLEDSDSNLWLSLEHPKNLANLQDAILRRLHDDDLGVVQAALSIDGLPGIVSPHSLLKALQDILFRCVDILKMSTSQVAPQACEVALSCLQRTVLDSLPHQIDHLREVASMMFPLLLVLPKTWRVKLKALEFAKKIHWPFYSDSFHTFEPPLPGLLENLEPGYVASINLKTIEGLAESLVRKPEEYIQWLIKCSSSFEQLKSLLFSIILQAVLNHKEDYGNLLKVLQAFFPLLSHEWHDMMVRGNIALAEEFTMEALDNACIGLMDQLFDSNFKALNSKLLVCIFWSLLKALPLTVQTGTSGDNSELFSVLDDLFVFFATSSSKIVFKEHMLFLVEKCTVSPIQFLSKFFTGEGVPVSVKLESLLSLMTICSKYTSPDITTTSTNNHLELLIGFPSLLVPLLNESKDIRIAAVNCIEALYKLWSKCDIHRVKNGDEMLSRCISIPNFGEFLGAIVSQKKLISSDVNFAPSFLTSMLSPSGHSLLAPEDTDKRFNQTAKDTILRFILGSALKLSSYGKLIVLSLFKEMGNAILRIEAVKSLLSELLERRNHYHVTLDRKTYEELSQTEIEILCLLLETSAVAPSSAHAGTEIVDHFIKALKVDGVSFEDPAIVRPCVTVLQNLSCVSYGNLKADIQDELFVHLVPLFRNENNNIRNAAKEAILRINIKCSTIARSLEFVLSQGHELDSSRMKRRKPSALHSHGFPLDLPERGNTILSFLNAVLDILLLRKDIKRRESMLEPLFLLLGALFSDDWILGLDGQDKRGSEVLDGIPQNISNAICYAQQATLIIIEDISASLLCDLPVKDDVFSKQNMNLLVECARATKNSVTRNHIFSLLSSVAKVFSGWVSEHMTELFTVIGESAMKQNDSHSQRILEDLISTLVPCWLSKMHNIKDLLQVFINVLPEVSEHRQMTLIVYLLRTLGEKNSLGMLLVLLIRSLIARRSKSSENGSSIYELFLSKSFTLGEWEYVFAVQLCSQYSCRIWLPCLTMLLQEMGMESEREEHLAEVQLAMHFIQDKLHDTELDFELASGQDSTYLQHTLGALMEQVVLHLQLVNVRSKQLCIPTGVRRQLKECVYGVLKTTTKSMVPSEYFKCVTRLLGHVDGSKRKKVLGFLCEIVKNHDLVQKKRKETRKNQRASIGSCLQIDESFRESFTEMCFKIVQLVDGSKDDSHIPTTLAAVSSLEVLAKEFPSDSDIFATCLRAVVKHIASNNLAISSSCLRSTGALVIVLGSKALPELPFIMKHVLARAHDVSHCPIGKFKYGGTKALDGLLSSKVSIFLSILATLEAVIDNLGCFLNPYLEDIIELMVLHPEYASNSDLKIKSQAATVRQQITEKIPVRLVLLPLLRIYPDALKCGEEGLSLLFEMLASAIGIMDRSSIVSYHAKIFEQCLLALNIRCQHPESVKNIDMVEQNVIHAITVLTLKLTETFFEPLFFRSLEWAESDVEESGSTESRKLDRLISFYKLVNKLTEQHRSLFVPYFKHLIEGCTRYLTDNQDICSPSSTQKRKRAKVGKTYTHTEEKGLLSPKQWHLRALILTSLYRCFLYDTGSLKFLDSSKFQILLKPIVSQLVAEPPASVERFVGLPSVEEVNESLVCCVGQMAVTVGSDDIWKPLNHEVLMQTRSEKMRPRILGLRVVKYLLQHLREEYLVVLPETIPFLSERLEDVELPVKSLAQEILKDLESLSCEDLQQYL